MTQKVKIKANGNQDLSLTLRDDGRVFHESLSISAQESPTQKSKVNLVPFILFGIAQIEIVIVIILNVLEVI